MNIHIDIGHPAHVHYFKNFIQLITTKGHTVSITARDKEVTLYLLTQNKLPFINRGKGKSGFWGKLFYIFKGDAVVFLTAKKNSADLFLSMASPYAAHASFLMGKPHIVIDDTEAATFGHLMYKPFSNVFVNPKAFKKDFGKKQIRFDGFIELCHLHPNYFSPDNNIYKELEISMQERYFVLRFISWEANHDFGHTGMTFQDKIKLIEELSKYGRVLFLLNQHFRKY